LKVAVYSIMKNEAKHISDYITNTRDADCIVLADTGSTDGSPFHAKFLGRFVNVHNITVSPFRFDVARNTALALVPPDVDVCISLDLDERLSEGWRANLERGWNQEPGTTKMGVMYETPGLKPFWHNSRIHARNGYYWMDPCHEHLWSWMIQEKEVFSKSVSILHTPDRSKSRKSYLPLLAAGLNEEPGKIRRMFYYAREMMVHKEYEIALGWFKKYVEIHERAGVEEWWESEQARIMIKVCEGAISEQKVKFDLLSPKS
jgi:glycosyltransferase involved in cell wall biosynthesis